MRNADALGQAYVRSAGPVRFDLVTRAIAEHLSAPMHIVDVGGGYGLQAILLARAGCTVTVLDCDPHMLQVAETLLGHEDGATRQRVNLILGDAERADQVVGNNYDLACCHSVLAYQEDPRPTIECLVRLVRPGGLLSILSLNPESLAMRSGLQGLWQEAIETIVTGAQPHGSYLDFPAPTRGDVTHFLERHGASVVAWYGVGIFSDHLSREANSEEIEQICNLEWLAGFRDPYRQVARCFHLIARRVLS